MLYFSFVYVCMQSTIQNDYLEGLGIFIIDGIWRSGYVRLIFKDLGINCANY